MVILGDFNFLILIKYGDIDFIICFIKIIFLKYYYIYLYNYIVYIM